MCGSASRCGSRNESGERILRYLPLSDADRSEMLRVIGAKSIDDLFTDVPEPARLARAELGPERSGFKPP